MKRTPIRIQVRPNDMATLHAIHDEIQREKYRIEMKREPHKGWKHGLKEPQWSFVFDRIFDRIRHIHKAERKEN